MTSLQKDRVKNTGELNMIYAKLYSEMKNLIIQYDLVNKAINLAKKNYRIYITDESELNGFPADYINYEIGSCCYEIDNLNLDTERDCICIDVNYYYNNKYLGYYCVLFSCENGEIVDDWISAD